MHDYPFVKKCLAISLLAFPVLSVLAFALHFNSLHGFFHFTLIRPPYNAGRLFDALARGGGHGFKLAHSIIYLAVPFMLVTVLLLSWYLLPHQQTLAMIGAALGIIGCLAMAGVIASWLSFAAVAHVQPESYPGARAALIELTTMQGILHVNTLLSYLVFVGMTILAGGLMLKRRFPPLSMSLIIAGSVLFMLFMDMDNWMLIGTLLISIGLIPVIKKLL